MRKLLRLIAVIFGIVVLIGVVLALVVPHLLDPNAYKERLSALVKERTGHTLTIGGDIKLSVFPWLAVELGPVQLSNAPGFGAAPLAQVQHTSVRVKLLPLLLHKQVEIDKISLDEVRVHLARDASGQVNWQGLSAASNTKAVSSTQSAAGPALALLEVGGIDLRNASVEWDDRRAGSAYQVSDLNVHTGRFAPGKPFDVTIGGAVASGQNAPAYRVQLNSTVNADPATQRYQLRKTRLELTLPQGGAVTLSSDVDLDLAQQSLVMPAIELSAHGLKLSGELHGTHILDNPDLRGELQLADFNPRELLNALGKPLPTSADAAVLAKASARFSLRAGRDQITLKPLSLRLDDSTVSGEFSIRDFAQPRFEFALNVDDINVDRYLPPPHEDKAGSPATAVAATPWPVATLRTLNLDGSLHVGRLQAYRLRSTEVRVTVKSQGGVLRVQPAGAQLYQGSYQGDVEIDTRTATPRISLNESLRAVQIGALLKDLQGDKARLSGKGDLSARLHGAGADPVALRRNLNGSLRFAFKDGAVRGFNLAAKIRKAKAVLKGEALAADSSPNQTDFSELTGTATVTDGVVRNDDLQGKSPYMRVTGAGQADLGAQNLDYLLKVVLVRTGTGQGGAGLAEASGITVPVRISGPFAQLSYRVDLNAAVGEAAKAKLKQKQQEFGQKLQDQLQNKLKGLFH